MMTRADYELSICEKLAEAEAVPFQRVSLPGWRPAVAHCHKNVDRWVASNPGSTAVRGWATCADFGDAIALTAHSVVRDVNGILFDITPLESECVRGTMRFVGHIGDEQTFVRMQALGIYIVCSKSVKP